MWYIIYKSFNLPELGSQFFYLSHFAKAVDDAAVLDKGSALLNRLVDEHSSTTLVQRRRLARGAVRVLASSSLHVRARTVCDELDSALRAQQALAATRGPATVDAHLRQLACQLDAAPFA